MSSSFIRRLVCGCGSSDPCSPCPPRNPGGFTHIRNIGAVRRAVIANVQALITACIPKAPPEHGDSEALEVNLTRDRSGNTKVSGVHQRNDDSTTLWFLLAKGWLNFARRPSMAITRIRKDDSEYANIQTKTDPKLSNLSLILF